MIFTKADRDRLIRIESDTFTTRKKLNEGLIGGDNQVEALKRAVSTLAADMEKKLNVVLAHISETPGVDTALVREEITCAANRVIDNQGRITDRLAVKGKENGLKKQVLKRKSGR